MLKSGNTVGRYAIEDILGEGGMGVVYKAHDGKLDRKVALKVLTPNGDGADQGEARVLREARAVAALDHPNAIAIYDVGEADGVPYIAMELASGKTLREYVGDASIPIGRRIGWLCDVARALAAAHGAGIVHRDIKPENVMVRADGRVKVLDFGIARRSSAVDPVAPTAKAPPATVTTRGTMGTPMYMAPEQARGKRADGRTDQFSWGVLAYEILEGTRPWDAPDLVGLVAAMIADPPRPMVAAGVPEQVRALIMRTLSRQPAERFGSMDDVVELLAPFADPAAAHAPGAPKPSPQSAGPSGGGGSGKRGGAPVSSSDRPTERLASDRYSTQELGQVLSRAIERQAQAQAQGKRYTRADLVEAAREVGIDDETLEDALSELRVALEPPTESLGAQRRRERQALLRHVALWAVFSVFFFLLNLATGGPPWFFYPVIAWGVGVAAHAVKYLIPVDPSPEEQIRQRRREEFKQQRYEKKMELERLRIEAWGKKHRIAAGESGWPARPGTSTTERAELEAIAAEEEARSRRKKRLG
ncbi:protein kinase domain-containing protein [Polyangium aurulentum]|uniref:protein kinase domain-containing protein n=1 Tax=Polyangium aurulentum TaxID=2567896 RepID=UPI0010AE5734|nr:protein kinase [Polyangium aurulentum]UQA55245.1 protein kinase [Polyangium aurulentum]